MQGKIAHLNPERGTGTISAGASRVRFLRSELIGAFCTGTKVDFNLELTRTGEILAADIQRIGR